jgi:mono/diheme cytochrome c family protein
MRSGLRPGDLLLSAAVALTCLAGRLHAASPTAKELAQTFDTSVKPFLATYCASCHTGEKPKGEFDLAPLTRAGSPSTDHKRWELVLERLRTGDMPPEEAPKQPSQEVRRDVAAWVDAYRASEGEKHAGDPGPVPARRLSNAEYNYTIRDLTGVDMRPTKDFPVDPANEAGFDNSAESLSTSPALVKKYLDAARLVADHLALTGDGFVFAPHPVIADTDRDKFCVNRIVAFYKRQPTDSADYFLTAWKFKVRAQRGEPNVTLAELAAQEKVSEKYLTTIWGALNRNPDPIGPIAALRSLWNSIRDDASPDEAKSVCDQMQTFVTQLRLKLIPVVKNLKSPKVQDGSQPLVIWKNEQMAENHTRYAGGSALSLTEWKLPADSVVGKLMEVPAAEEERSKYEAACERFCATFPDAFYISERGRVFQNEESRGRLLSAGFHNQQGYFRDDAPLYEMLLDDAGRKELDRLWREFDLISEAPQRQYRSFIWYERAESSFIRDEVFDGFRSEDKDSISEAKIRDLKTLYLEKAINAGAGETARTTITNYFDRMNASFREIEKAHVEAEPRHLDALLAFAAQAYRRPLSTGETQSLGQFYRTLRDQEGLRQEDAIRDGVVSVLMSPNFLFRLGSPPGASEKPVPLSDYDLAERLSYFLWASLPDEELLNHAAAGRLQQPEVLAAQVRRMLASPKVRGMAVEFGGNWLDFRRFEEHNAVDRTRFPEFDNDLRQAMFEEPVRFFIDVAGRDGSVLDFLDAAHTFVNKPLARHYGIPYSEPKGDPDEWVRVDDAAKYGRGGLAPMAVFLTRNAPGLRTSPVKRGYWVARRLLGEHIPAPPPNVPELPADESKSELPLREALARHREHPSCSGCHQRFDSLGLAFEGYGPIGERRTKDLGGRPIDATAQFPDGTDGTGLAGLQKYIRESRQSDFVENFNRKLLAYALGRTLLLSDEKLLREMRERLESNDHRFSAVVQSVVASPQFRYRRGSAVSQ